MGRAIITIGRHQGRKRKDGCSKSYGKISLVSKDLRPFIGKKVKVRFTIELLEKKCSLCLRVAPVLDRHHILPKHKEKKKGIGPNSVERVCKACHKVIHYTFTNGELRKLAEEGFDIGNIKGYEKLFPKKAKFLKKGVKWIKKSDVLGMKEPKKFFYKLEHGLNPMKEFTSEQRIEYSWRKLEKRRG